MNAWLQWFRRLTWVGIVANLGFILPALFSPDMFDAVLGPGSSALSYAWLANAGLVLGIATLFYIPAGRIRSSTGSTPGCPCSAGPWPRLLALAESALDLPGPIQGFWMMDGVFSVIFLVLLTLGFREPAAQRPRRRTRRPPRRRRASPT